MQCHTYYEKEDGGAAFYTS